MPDSRVHLAPFVGGLNTEQSSVTDLLTYTSDELNCTVYPEELRGRRYGMDVEIDGQWFATGEDVQVAAGYFWKNVGKTPRDFAVFQTNSKLHFYDATVKPFSSNKIVAVVDVTDYITDTNNFYRFPIKFTTGDGDLIAVSKYMEPLKISFVSGTSTFNVERIVIKYRDIEGVPESLNVDEQPSELTKAHQYNLKNQGWNDTQIKQFHTDKERYPANNLQ